MKEILVTIYVLSLQQDFDMFIPIKFNMNEAIDLIQDTIVNLSNGNYQKVEHPLLFTDSGNVVNNNNNVKYSGLKNGSKVILK